MAQGVPTVFDRVFDDRRLGRRVLTLWAKPLHAADGRLIGMLCGSQNHSERDDLLRELNDTAQRMGAEERARTAFAATMSREVRGVFRGISAMIDLVLAQPVIDDTQREPLKVAHVMTTQLHGLFSDMRDFNRLQSGRVHLAPQPQDLRSLLEACVAGHRGQAEAKGLVLELQVGRLQESRVWVDAKRLRQVLDNLLSNALKFTDSGGVACRLNSMGCGKGQVEVTLEVEDSGIGIEEEELEHLFEPFRQLPDQQRLLRGGSGLGLTLCRELLALMGGSIALSSQPGHGTRATARLVLPVAGG
ncbi:Virulence sensor protein BvgS precursor [compost metagenome]